MFSCIVPGRLPQTMQKVESASDTCIRFSSEMSNIQTVKEVMVFMIGSTPFPDDMGGTVHFVYRSSSGKVDSLNIGCISNAIPSAIFNISSFIKQAFGDSVQIGISVKPLDQIVQTPPVLSQGLKYRRALEVKSLTQISTAEGSSTHINEEYKTYEEGTSTHHAASKENKFEAHTKVYIKPTVDKLQWT